MAKRKTKKAKKKTTKAPTVTYSFGIDLTPREKKAIIEKEVFCRECKELGKRVLAAKCTDDGVPLCREHGG